MSQKTEPTTFDFAGAVASTGLGNLELSALEFERGLPSRIADQLAVAIIEGKLAPGARLSEPELAETFGTSRTPVREALRILERDALVELIPRRGAWVTTIDAQRAMAIYVCRAYLYGLAARSACTRIDDDELEELNEIVELMERFVRDADLDGYFRLNVLFHSRVTDLAENPMLSVMIEQLGRVTLRLRYLAVSLPGRADASLKAHQQLIVALREKHRGRAERIVRSLIRDSGVGLLRHHYEDGPLADELDGLLTDIDD
jgi:DNA-binding GntR family transcriptional regulator